MDVIGQVGTLVGEVEHSHERVARRFILHRQIDERLV